MLQLGLWERKSRSNWNGAPGRECFFRKQTISQNAKVVDLEKMYILFSKEREFKHLYSSRPQGLSHLTF